MANDMLAGPEMLILSDRLFYFSPLSDGELSQLTSWVSWRREKKIEQCSVEWFEDLATLQGVTQVFWHSVKRNEPFSVIEAAAFIKSHEQLCNTIFEFWYKLNFVDVPYPEVEIEKDSPKAEKEYIYTMLARKYKYTLQEIQALTPYQQFVLYAEYDGSGKLKTPTVEFANEAERQQWLANRSK